MSQAQRSVPETAGDRVRQHILDVAEAQFAERGFFGASVRDVTDAAGVRLAAINYHFETKEELFRSVLLRRAEQIGAERLKLLERVATTGSQTRRVRAVVEAFVQPLLSRALGNDQGWRNYFSLVAQIANTRMWVLTLVAEHFNRTATEFIGAFAKVFPRASKRKLHDAYQLMLSGTLYSFSNNGRLESLTRGDLRSDAYQVMSDALVDFATAGVVVLCSGTHGRGGSERRRR
jgi:AcrR family transcriptional regulator